MALKISEADAEDLVEEAIRTAQESGNPVTVVDGLEADKRTKAAMGPTVARLHQGEICGALNRLMTQKRVVKTATGEKGIIGYTSSSTPTQGNAQRYTTA